MVSDIPECMEVVEDKAVVFRRGNVDELAKCLQTLCDENQSVLNIKSIAGDFICSKYNWEAVTAQTLHVYGETR